MTSDEKSLRAMQEDWRMVLKRERGILGLWQQRLAAMIAAEAALRDQGRWVHGREDFLGVVSKHRDELTHSRAIAWLLDPCGKHGLGTRVLSSVLRTVFGADDLPQGLHLARVRCE